MGNQIQFDTQQLIDNELYLSLQLLTYTKISLMANDRDRSEYLQELQMKLALKKSTEATESRQCMLWAFIISSCAHIYRQSQMTKVCMENIVKHLQNSMNQSESWSDGLLSVVGFKKETESNDKKILVRCFSIAILALLSSDEYGKSLNELNILLEQKKFADVKVKGLQAISLIESSKSKIMGDFNETIAKIIRIFYLDNFLISFEYLYGW